MYSKRIKWLMQSSRKVFGLVQGEKVAVLIDSSNANMGFGRAIEIQDALLVISNDSPKSFSQNVNLILKLALVDQADYVFLSNEVSNFKDRLSGIVKLTLDPNIYKKWNHRQRK